ncbi:MAG: hypothetical protein KKA32_06165 [Actinobacteria bacterium]|nr:hypothetical protein [Actinomycetota bacterium]
MLNVEDRRAFVLPPSALALVFMGAALHAASITVLFLASRVIMGLGGFVATGGPYEIAHPAPDWIAAIPLSFFVGGAALGIHWLGARRGGGFSLLPFMWIAVFLSLGVAFLEAGIGSPSAGGLVWTWL